MNEIVEKLMESMPESPTELSEGNCKKIKSYMPVPTDFNILWADIKSFSGYPAGIIITDKGIVFKASRKDLKANKNKESSREKELKIYYQIILWEYFSPDQYEFVLENVDGIQVYALKIDGKVVSFFDNKTVYNFFENYNDELERLEEEAYNFNAEAALSEVETLGFEQAAFNAAYGADQSATGHGIYAEEGGTILDKLHGDQATVVGRDNAKNGPDKLVNGKPVQCKFCKTASSSVGACFKKNPDTGLMEYRYFDLKSGKPMQVEVPSDQYEKALQSMQNRIKKGQVPGITDPDAAKDLVRKSRLTYNQARNLAKAGTFESLTYDVATGTVTCSFIAGISSLVSFGLVYWQTKDRKKAQDAAVNAAIQVFGPTLAANIISNQIARTGLTDAMIPLSEKITNALGTKTVQKLINAKRVLMGQNKIYGNAASKSFAKALRSNFVSEGVMFVVFSVPDTYRVITQKISGAQYVKNMVSLGAAFMGNIAGAYGAGIAAGAIGEKIGKKVNKKVGAAVGFVGGLVGGTTIGIAVKSLTGLFKEDDTVITARLFNAAVANMAIEYFLSEKEIEKLIEKLNEDSKEIGKMQRRLLSSERQYYDLMQFLEPYFDKVSGEREVIKEDQIFDFKFELQPSMA